MNKVCRIQYVCGLYVDKFEKNAAAHFVKPAAPILVLNGNIGKPTSIQTFNFLNHCSKIWHAVLYIPGTYELAEEAAPALMKSKFQSLSNVHVLNNNTLTLPKYGTTFLGSPDDKKWLTEKFIEIRNQNNKIVALTSQIPDINMVHPKDMKGETKPKFLYPQLNAWICGYPRGAHAYTYANNLTVMYNALGPIDGVNDYGQGYGFNRAATFTVPESTESMS